MTTHGQRSIPVQRHVFTSSVPSLLPPPPAYLNRVESDISSKCAILLSPNLKISYQGLKTGQQRLGVSAGKISQMNQNDSIYSIRGAVYFQGNWIWNSTVSNQ